jgi:DNA-binding PadR family transcriptional regulator
MFRRPFGRGFRGPEGEPEPHDEYDLRDRLRERLYEHGRHGRHHEHGWGGHEHHRGPGPRFGGRPPFEDAFWFGPRDRGFWRGGPFGGPFGGDPSDEDGGGRRRQRRGDIKYALLELLAEQPRHGYELIKELEQRYGGFYRPSPGSVYPTLQLLEDEGHLTSETLEGKRVYTITDSGRQLLEERRGPGGPGEHGPHRHGFRERGGPDLAALRDSGMALTASLMQVARHGTPEQVEAVMKLLDSARREVYAILSQGPEDQQESQS